MLKRPSKEPVALEDHPGGAEICLKLEIFFDPPLKRVLIVKAQDGLVPRAGGMNRLVGIGEVDPGELLTAIDERDSLGKQHRTQNALPTRWLLRGHLLWEVAYVENFLNTSGATNGLQRRRQFADHSGTLQEPLCYPSHPLPRIGAKLLSHGASSVAIHP